MICRAEAESEGRLQGSRSPFRSSYKEELPFSSVFTNMLRMSISPGVYTEVLLEYQQGASVVRCSGGEVLLQ